MVIKKFSLSEKLEYKFRSIILFFLSLSDPLKLLVIFSLFKQTFFKFTLISELISSNISKKLDFASVSTTYLNMDNTEKMTDLFSYGIGLRFSSSLYGQPLYLRIDRVLDAKINEKEPIGKADWVFSFQKIIN